MAEQRTMQIPIPSIATSTAVLAFVGLVPAIVTFVWVFMAAAGDLELAQQRLQSAQIDLRQFTTEISKQVIANTSTLKEIGQFTTEISKQVIANTSTLKEIESAVQFLVCKEGPEPEKCER